MSTTDILILAMAYCVTGFNIGFTEIGAPAYAQCALCRRHPFLYLIEQTLLWPIFFILLRRFRLVSQTVKLTLVVAILFFTSKFIFAFISIWVWWWLSALIILVFSFFAGQLLIGLLAVRGMIPGHDL